MVSSNGERNGDVYIIVLNANYPFGLAVIYALVKVWSSIPETYTV